MPGIFPKGQMVSLGTYAQSSCHWQEMTNVGFREVALKWDPGALGYDCNSCDQKRFFLPLK